MLSISGSPESRTRISTAGLSDCVVTNEKILSDAEVKILTIRPEQVTDIGKFPINPDSTILSAIAGVTKEVLDSVLNHAVIRIMPSTPMTIEANKGICAVYPNNEITGELLNYISIR